MRRVVLAALLLALAAPAPAEAAVCARPGEDVLVEGDGAVLLQAERGRHRTVYVACDPATGRRDRIGSSHWDLFSTTGAVTMPTATGPWLAWLEVSADKGSSYGIVVAHDVRSGQTVRSTQLLDDDGVRELAVGPTGRTAVRTATAVLVVDGDGLRRVDRAAPGGLRSLRVASDRVVWRHGATERSAPLDLPAAACPIAAQAVTQSTDLALTGHVDLDGDGVLSHAACARSGGGWLALPGTVSSLVGGLVAVQRGRTVRVIDIAARAPIRPPVRPLRPLRDAWALAADGTLVVARGHRLVAHPPRGGHVVLGRVPRSADGWTIDDQEREVTWWDGRRRGSLPLVPPCVTAGERIVTRGDDLVVVARTVPDRGADDVVYTGCRPSVGRRIRLAWAGDT